MMQLTLLQAALTMAETYLSGSRGARLGCSLGLLCISPEGKTCNQQLATDALVVHHLCEAAHCPRSVRQPDTLAMPIHAGSVLYLME